MSSEVEGGRQRQSLPSSFYLPARVPLLLSGLRLSSPRATRFEKQIVKGFFKVHWVAWCFCASIPFEPESTPLSCPLDSLTTSLHWPMSCSTFWQQAWNIFPRVFFFQELSLGIETWPKDSPKSNKAVTICFLRWLRSRRLSCLPGSPGVLAGTDFNLNQWSQWLFYSNPAQPQLSSSWINSFLSSWSAFKVNWRATNDCCSSVFSSWMALISGQKGVSLLELLRGPASWIPPLGSTRGELRCLIMSSIPMETMKGRQRWLISGLLYAGEETLERRQVTDSFFTIENLLVCCS